jgi:hypothetical protein
MLALKISSSANTLAFSISSISDEAMKFFYNLDTRFPKSPRKSKKSSRKFGQKIKSENFGARKVSDGPRGNFEKLEK